MIVPQWLSPPRARLVDSHSVTSPAYEALRYPDALAGVAPSGQDHPLAPRPYAPRIFHTARVADIYWTRSAKLFVAAGGGPIEDFAVGSPEAWPVGLVTQDLATVGRNWRPRLGLRAERVDGLAVPFCHYGQPAFGHFVLDGLLQVYLNWEALISGRARLVHWPFEQAWMADVLDAVGAPQSARYELTGPVAWLREASLSSALAGHGVYFPGPHAFDFFAWLRGRLGSIGSGQPKRQVYVRRASDGARPVLEQARLEAALIERGVTVLDPARESFTQQAQLIGSADTLISAWGSGLTLAPLLGGRRRVVELTPATVTDVWFMRQAVVHKLDYWPILHPVQAGGIMPDHTRILAALDAS